MREYLKPAIGADQSDPLSETFGYIERTLSKDLRMSLKFIKIESLNIKMLIPTESTRHLWTEHHTRWSYASGTKTMKRS